MPKDRGFATFVLTAVLVIPVALYQLAPPLEDAPAPRPPIRHEIRPARLHPQDPEPLSPAPTPAAKPPAEPPAEPPNKPPYPAPETAVAPPVEPDHALARDPTLSPFDLFKIRRAALAPPGHVSPNAPPRPNRIEQRYDVQAVIMLGLRKTAIVNGEAVSRGDKIGKVRVVDITKDSVRFCRRERCFNKKVGQ